MKIQKGLLEKSYILSGLCEALFSALQPFTRFLNKSHFALGWSILNSEKFQFNVAKNYESKRRLYFCETADISIPYIILIHGYIQNSAKKKTKQ